LLDLKEEDMDLTNLNEKDYDRIDTKLRLVHSIMIDIIQQDPVAKLDSNVKNELDTATEAIWRAVVRSSEEGTDHYDSEVNARVKLASKASPYRKEPYRGPWAGDAKHPGEQLQETAEDLKGMIRAYTERKQDEDHKAK